MIEAAVLERVLARLPGGSRGTPAVSELSGGLTNRNYKLVTAGGSYVVRVWADGSELLAVDRQAEHENSLRAAAAGVGAPVVACLPGDGVLVIGFIDGVTLTDRDLGTPGTLARLAASCRRLHGGERFVNDFDMFDIQRRYLDLVLRRGFRLPADYESFAPQLEQIRRALAARSVGTVPCNNDLLAANLIDDGAAIRLIDYEYSGNNDACFELGNIWSECHLGLEQLEELVTAYVGRPSRSWLARAQLQGLMSKYGWTLWGSIQAATSELDFDFREWSAERFESAVEMFRSNRFESLLDDASEEP